MRQNNSTAFCQYIDHINVLSTPVYTESSILYLCNNSIRASTQTIKFNVLSPSSATTPLTTPNEHYLH